MKTCRCSLPSPGGIALTKHALELCRFPSGAKLADIGCGVGESVRYVNECTEFTMTGIDKDPAIAEAVTGGCCLCGDASALPFAACTFDGIFFECSFSKLSEPESALREAFRVLKVKGRLVVADFYALESEANFSGLMGRVERQEKISARFSAAGFTPLLFEDYTHGLREFWGQLIFDYGTEVLDELLGGCGKITAARCGYGLFIAERPLRK